MNFQFQNSIFVEVIFNFKILFSVVLFCVVFYDDLCLVVTANFFKYQKLWYHKILKQ